MRPSPFYLLVGALSRPLIYGVFRLRAEGVENLPKEGGFVLAANHTSNLDPWPLALPLWPRRYLRFMAKSELYWWPLGSIITAAGGFPVRRGESDVEAIRTAVELVHEGYIVAMFPHGTRQRKGLVKKHRPRPHSGAARIAFEAAVPLVPAAIAGTGRISRLEQLRVRYGRPMAIEPLGEREPAVAARETTERLMAEIEHLEEGL